MTQVIRSVSELTALRDSIRAQQAALANDHHQRVRLCMGASCIASGALAVRAAMEKELRAQGLSDRVALVETGCLGPCSAGPVLIIGDVFYEAVRPEDCQELVAEHLQKGRILDRLTHRRPDGRGIPHAAEMDFFKRQT